MSDLWTPSDELLGADPIAAMKVAHPFDPPELELPDDLRTDAACEAAAAITLAELDGDEIGSEEPGDVDDSADEDDDNLPIGDDV